MLHNNINSFLITTKHHKQKLTSYVTNEDNASADKAKFVKQLKDTINLTSNTMLTRVTASSSKSSTHSLSLDDTHINASGNDYTKHTYNVIVSLDNDKIISNTPICSGSHQSKSIQNENNITHHTTVDTEDDTDTPIHSGSHQSRSIQKQKEVTHHTAIDIEDDMEPSLDLYVEIIEKPCDNAKAELGQLYC